MNKISIERARLDLAKEQRQFLREAIGDIGAPLNLHDTEKMIEASGNEFRALKILLSMYRRIRIVARYQEDEKILLPKRPSENTIPEEKM